jgi:hypothetical protein
MVTRGGAAVVIISLASVQNSTESLDKTTSNARFSKVFSGDIDPN